MNARELLNEFLLKTFDPPWSDLRDSDEIRNPSNPLAIAMLIYDFETEVTMSGIVDFLGNSTGRYAQETVAALRAIGCIDDSVRLQEIIDIAKAAGMTHQAMQSNLSEVPLHSVTSFEKLHGDKWNDASEAISEVGSRIDYQLMIKQLEGFAERHSEAFRAALNS